MEMQGLYIYAAVMPYIVYTIQSPSSDLEKRLKNEQFALRSNADHLIDFVLHNTFFYSAANVIKI